MLVSFRADYFLRDLLVFSIDYRIQTIKTESSTGRNSKDGDSVGRRR